MRDLYESITTTIIQKLEEGTAPWRKPWQGGENNNLELPKNAVNGHKYRGINIPMLWIAADEKGYDNQNWASFKQWSDKGESVAKNEKGTMIVYYGTFEKEVDNIETVIVPFLKSSYVFNSCQLKGYESKPKDDKPIINKVEAIAKVDEFISNTQSIVIHDEKRQAYYNRSEDKIYMPQKELFIDSDVQSASEGYYATLLHEHGHWSGAPKRLNRTFGKRFGDKDYAFEELCAEMGSAFLCADLGITDGARDESASYIQSWVQILQNDKKAILTAASEASKISDYMCSLQNKQDVTAVYNVKEIQPFPA